MPGFVRTRSIPAVVVLTALLTLLWWISLAGASSAPGVTPRVALERLPLAFEPNLGQAPADVRYVSEAAGYRLWLTPTGARLAATGSEAPHGGTIELRWIGGAGAPTVVPEAPLPGKGHYYLGADRARWRENVPLYARVVYREVYPGVDLVFHGTQRDLEFDFVVRPGADPERVRLEIDGGDAVALDGGDLVIHRGAARVRVHSPTVYQETADGRQPVAGRFVLQGRQVAFRLGPYDRSRTLVIDPVLTYSTYLGDTSNGFGGAIGVDGTQNMYVAVGASRRVIKLSADGSTLLYSTVVNDFSPGQLAVDAAGNAYVSGGCGYPRGGFAENCATTSVLASGQPTAQGDIMGVVWKLRPDGTLVASTTIGGNGTVEITGIAADPAGNVFITGWNAYGNFPRTREPFARPGVTEGQTSFVQAIAADFSRYLYAAVFATGNEGSFVPDAIAVDGAGGAYVAGFAATTQFPTTAGALQPTAAAPGAAVVARIAPGASSLVYATYLGNTQTNPRGLAVDGAGNAYVAGFAGAGLPVTNALQVTPAGANDAFVTKLNASGSALAFSTYLGGSRDDAAVGVGLDSAGNVYVAGGTESLDFPQRDALSPEFGAVGSNFVTALAPAGNALLYSTYFADSQSLVSAMAVTPGGTVYLTGVTSSTGYPTVRPYRAAPGGLQDGFVARLEPADSTCGTGRFFAQYFANVGLTPPAARTACETALSHDYGAGGPGGLPGDNFSARWTGRFSFAGGSVTFTARADDGVRLYLDGTLIIDGWRDQPATTYTATRTVTAGEHEVKVEYYERGGDAVIQVSWASGGGGGGCPAGQFLAQYFAGIALTPPAARTACETGISYGWGPGSPAGLPTDSFSARWTGRFPFAAGAHEFTVRADDGVRLFVDGTLVIDGWRDQPATTYTATRTLTAGEHEVKVEYYERGGDASVQASWRATGTAPPPSITSLTPSSRSVGSPDFTLTVNGANFVSGATVSWNGQVAATTFVSPTRVTASIAAFRIASPGTVPVYVLNPDGQRSNTVTFTINASTGCPGGQFSAQYFGNATLTPPATGSECVAAINYNWTTNSPVGLPSDNFSIRWVGIVFFAGGATTFTARADDGIRVFLDGVPVIDQWRDQPATTYTATVDVSGGHHEVTVEYYERGGAAVAQVSWTTGGTAPAPTVTALAPPSATAGGPAFTLTVDGTGFLSGATVLWTGAPRPTTFVGSTRVSASISASDIAAAGSVPVTVRNPDGQTSNAATFTIGSSGGGPTIRVFITAPSSGATVRGTVWFTVWIENAATGSKTYTLSVGTSTITSTTTTSNGPVSLAWPTSAADNGSRTAAVTVRDSAGATGRATLTLTVAN
jgi:hypothetical protein